MPLINGLIVIKFFSDLSLQHVKELYTEGVCVWGVGVGGGWLNFLSVHIHIRFRHAHHETIDWLPSLGSRGGSIY